MAPPTIGTQKKRKSSPSASRKSILKLDAGPPPAKKQRLKPLFALSKPPVFDLTTSESKLSSQSSPTTSKGKAKAKFVVADDAEDDDGALWVDMYEPVTQEDLAVHARKVNDVQQWFLEAFEGGPSGKLRKYRRILVLTGPAGAAKTATIRVLSHELGFDIMEWRNLADENFYRNKDYNQRGDGIEYEGLSDKFHAFLSRATNSSSIFTEPSLLRRGPSKSTASQSSQPLLPNKTQVRRVVLLEDLPNVLHPLTQAAFHASLQSFVASQPSSAPVVIIISDAGVRGEAEADGISQTWKGKAREVVDVRTVLPSSLLKSPYVTQISFNPIAPTLMKRALQRLLNAHASSSHRKIKGRQPSKDILDLVVETSSGDIRSAIMALQFACMTSSTSGPIGSSGTGGKSKGKTSEKAAHNSRALLEVTSRREQSLVLFHLLGKILYNKRKGDPPSSSASARDIQREKEIDMHLKTPPKLPAYLSEHDRRASRVDVETLYSDSPIDASLLSLYIHQNYTQYCNTLDECDGVIDWLSWVDSNGGESWLQANPHQFHLVTLGTLHSLPSPVPRRGQKAYKPEFFDNLKTTREGEDGLQDIQDWLRRHGSLGASWTRKEIALEMGGVLKAYDATGFKSSSKPPPTHRNFSRLVFARGMTALTDVVDDGQLVPDEGDLDEEVRPDPEMAPGGWLESDDIEDF